MNSHSGRQSAGMLRALVLASTPESALKLFAEMVHLGCRPDYQQVEVPEDADAAWRDEVWDVLIGLWFNHHVAAGIAVRALETPIANLRSHTVLNYGGAAMLAIVRDRRPEMVQEADRLIAVMDGVFREIQEQPGAEGYTPPHMLALAPSLPASERVMELARDLNSFLTVIIGCGEVLLRETSPYPARARYASDLLNAAANAKVLVADLLGLGYARGHGVTDVGSAVAQMREALQGITGERMAVEIVMTGKPALVALERNQVEMIVLNMAAKALLAIPQQKSTGMPVLQMAVKVTQLSGTPIPGEYVTITFRSETRGAKSPDTVDQPDVYQVLATKQDADQLGLLSVYDVTTGAGGGIAVSAVSPRSFVTVFFPVIQLNHMNPPRTTSPRKLEPRVPEKVDARRAVDAALRVLSSYSRHTAWNGEDEVTIRRWVHDIRSPVEAVACAVLFQIFQADLPE
jgi:pentatricopeptide repeat protein